VRIARRSADRRVRQFLELEHHFGHVFAAVAICDAASKNCLTIEQVSMGTPTDSASLNMRRMSLRIRSMRKPKSKLRDGTGHAACKRRIERDDVASGERLGEFARELGGWRALVVTDPGLDTAGHPRRVLPSLPAANPH